jgi:predicted CopG family antitoxin
MRKSYARHTVMLNDSSYELLKKEGYFGETYSDLILRILIELKRSRGNGRSHNGRQ